MVTAVYAWHEHHLRAAGEIRRRLTAGESMVIASRTIIETYSVLTRLPPPYRISPSEALARLDANILVAERELVALTVDDYRTIVRRGLWPAMRAGDEQQPECGKDQRSPSAESRW